MEPHYMIDRVMALRLLGWLAVCLLALAFACDDGDDGTGDDDDATVDDDDASPGDDDDNDDAGDDDDDTPAPLPWLKATTGDEPAIFDALGRQVLLRGVNFNHLGDYFETSPLLPTVADLGPDDWDDAAALGTNVIRLVTSWSAWEPERDQFDLDYLARVRDAVAEANARGMYVVIDMHQDAWSRFVFTPVDETCAEGTWHQRGWDGAPQWATFTDDEPTCTPGRREESPAVIRAWDNFYDNREGIRDELAELWGRIAQEFAAEPGVAGFDLLNEPGTGSGLLSTSRGLTAYYRSAVAAIREAEAEADSPGHIIFFELSVDGVPPSFGLHIPNSVFAPHNYFESIVQGPEGLLDFSFWLYDLLGRFYRAAVWIGEYNSFSDPDTNEAWMTRYAALDDRYLQAGGTWWQWEQECGDPHSVQYPPTPEWIEQQRETCGDARFPLTTCLSRGYPRAVPGRLESLSAEPCLETVIVTGSTASPGIADLWLPSESDNAPTVTGAGIADYTARRVDGGWRIDVNVTGHYRIEVTP
jgi:endoglycosylceramidase